MVKYHKRTTTTTTDTNTEQSFLAPPSIWDRLPFNIGMEYHSNPHNIHEQQQSIWQNSSYRNSINRKLCTTTHQFCDSSKCCRSCTQRFYYGTLLKLSKINTNNHRNNTMPTNCTTTNPAVYLNNRISNLAMSKINLNQIQTTTKTTSFTRLKLIGSRKNGNESCWRHNNFIRILLLILLGLSSSCLAVRQDAASECIFPQRWEGSWFLSGYQQSIHIKSSQFSYRGKCKASDGNKYLIVDEKGCHRCLVIYEKHKNVLQYKESECEGDSMYMDQSMNPAAMPMRSIVKSDHNRGGGGAHPNMNGHTRLSSSDQYIMRSNDDSNDCFCRGREILQNLCDQIPGDALLYSLFREQAEPVKCPLKGPFTFTYNRGHGECKSPVSNIESCTDDSRLLLNFQACPDVQGTESAAEELTCLATWKDGNSRYLVGLVSHHHAISNEERFRCFVYEKISSMMGTFPGNFNGPVMKDAEYKLAQSGDATCNGLDSAEVGSRIMTLRKPPLAERCDFPTWFKGPRHWHGLMGKSQYIFHPSDGSMQIKKPNGNMETRAFCEQINKQTATELMAVVHHTTGCLSGFMCMMFYRRDTHIAEIQIGTPASRLEDACAPDHFDIGKMQFITLLASSPEQQICPLEGLYTLRGAIGPPHKISRHKRNHNNNNNNNNGHTHHHHQHHRNYHETSSEPMMKRHGTFSLRNTNEWHGPSSLSSSLFPSISSEKTSAVAATVYNAKQRRLLQLHNRKRRSAAAAAVTQHKIPLINQNPIELTSTDHSTIPLLTNSINNDAKVLTTESSAAGIISSTLVDTLMMDRPFPKLIKDFTKLQLSVDRFLSDTENSINDEIDQNPRISSSPSSSSKYTQSIQILNQRNRRETPACIVNYKDQRHLWIGCTEPNIIDVRPQCNDDGDEVYYCHGSWNENGTIYVIAKHSGTQHGVCITYQPGDGKDAKLIVGDLCVRPSMKPNEHHLVANIKNFGKCGDPSSSNIISSNLLLIIVITISSILLTAATSR